MKKFILPVSISVFVVCVAAFLFSASERNDSELSKSDIKTLKEMAGLTEADLLAITCPNPGSGVSQIRTVRHYSMGADSVQVCRFWINDVPVLPLTLTTTGSGAATFTPSIGVLNVPTPSASGTVTSVGVTSSNLTVSGSPVTSSGNISVSLPNVVTSGTGGIVTVDAQGRVTSYKRQETYRGTTNASGLYTVTYGTAYSVTPTVVPSFITNDPRDVAMVTASSTTGFTIQVQRRVDVLGLLPSYSNRASVTVDVNINEQ